MPQTGGALSANCQYLVFWSALAMRGQFRELLQSQTIDTILKRFEILVKKTIKMEKQVVRWPVIGRSRRVGLLQTWSAFCSWTHHCTAQLRNTFEKYSPETQMRNAVGCVGLLQNRHGPQQHTGCGSNAVSMAEA